MITRGPTAARAGDTRVSDRGTFLLGSHVVSAYLVH